MKNSETFIETLYFHIIKILAITNFFSIKMITYVYTLFKLDFEFFFRFFLRRNFILNKQWTKYVITHYTSSTVKVYLKKLTNKITYRNIVKKKIEENQIYALYIIEF